MLSKYGHGNKLANLSLSCHDDSVSDNKAVISKGDGVHVMQTHSSGSEASVARSRLFKLSEIELLEYPDDDDISCNGIFTRSCLRWSCKHVDKAKVTSGKLLAQQLGQPKQHGIDSRQSTYSMCL